MKTVLLNRSMLVLFGFVGGVITTNFQFVSASTKQDDVDLKDKKFMVSIYEVQRNLVFDEIFIGSYSKTVTLSDGSKRTINLTPLVHDGIQVVKFEDTGGVTYMGLNGTTTNGKLMVQLYDVEKMQQALKEEGWK
ncbi:hypothetical protein [Thiolapillus sp.]